METEILTFNEIQEQGTTFFTKLWESFVAYIPTLLVALGLFIIGTIINKIVMKLLSKGLKRSRLDVTIHSFLKSLVKVVLYSVVIIMVLSLLGIPMTSIITVVGSAGLAIGLSMKDSLSNVAGGMLILFEKPFKKDDFIDINGISGTCKEISILNTKLRTADNKVIYLPNGSVANATIINYSQMPTRRIEWTFSISYDNDFRKAIGVIQNIANTHEKINSSPEPFVRGAALGTSSVDIIVRVWVNSSDYWDVYYDMVELIKEEFDKEGITIPYNQLDVHVIK